MVLHYQDRRESQCPGDHGGRKSQRRGHKGEDARVNSPLVMEGPRNKIAKKQKKKTYFCWKAPVKKELESVEATNEPNVSVTERRKGRQMCEVRGEEEMVRGW